jgi:hypothetical protein
MRVPVSTKITAEQKMVLEYLAFRDNRKRPAELIRQAIIDLYDLDSVSLLDEARSFFASTARRVDQSSDASRNYAAKARVTSHTGR